MKKFLMCILIICLTISGCSNVNKVKSEEGSSKKYSETTNQEALKHNEEGGKELSVNFKVVNPTEVPESLSNMISKYKFERSYLSYEIKEKNYIVVFAGAKSSGGFSLEILDAKHKEGILYITVKENSPSPEETVTQAITYPYIIISLEKYYANVIIKDEKGMEYNKVKEMEM